MRTIFIINPFAGRRKTAGLAEKIRLRAEESHCQYEIYITKSVGDATRFVREVCETEGAARFIACGGDGTLSEVVNGAIGFDGAEVGVIPMGTGNDFCRNFGKDLDFKDIALQISGKTAACDTIRYKTSVNGNERCGYGVNMFNIGFDCNVADFTSTVKKRTPLRGSLAYFAAILVTLIKKKCPSLKIELDGRTVHDGKLLLSSLANGSFCGGGVKSNPLADVCDGLININIINNVSRLKFISLLPCYMDGSFPSVRGIERVISTLKCKKVTVTPKSEGMRLCVDGEIIDAGRTEFEIMPAAFRFVVPKKP